MSTPFDLLARSSHAWRALLACVLALVLAPAAWANDSWPLKTGYFVDPSGQMDIEEVRSQAFKPFTGLLSRGYTADTVWVRLEVAPSDAPELVLMVRPAHLDQIRLYSPRTQSALWQVQDTGEKVAFNARPRQEVNYALTIRPDPDQSQVHYLRVKTTGTMMISTRLVTPSASQSFDVFMHGFMGIYQGVVLLLAWLALVRWWVTRERMWGVSCMFQVVTLLFMPTITGFSASYIWPDSATLPDLVGSTLACLHFAAASLFFLLLVRAYHAPGLTTIIYIVPLLALPVELYWLATGDTLRAMSLNVNLLTLQAFFGFGVVWFLRIDDKILRYLIRSVYLGLTGYLMYLMVPMLGLAPAGEMNLNPSLLSAFFVAVLQHVVLVRRSQLAAREQLMVNQKMSEVSEKLKWESARRAETNSFMSMLMHEIKNPLASIRIATQSLVSGRVTEVAEQTQRLRNIQKSVQGIDTVLERCIETDRLEQGVLVIDKVPHNVARLLRDWVAGEAQQDRIQLDAPPELIASVDAPLLAMMVRNLLTNALNYSPERSPVTVSLSVDTQASTDSVLIRVSNAVGRAGRPDVARVFEKYYRAPGAHHVTGTGLGLYWVHSVAQMLGGSIRCQVNDQSVEFALWVPR
jgi:two-component system, sensor histidine kinase LadS